MMGRFRAFLFLTVGKWPNFGPKFNFRNEILGLQELYMTQYLVCTLLGINQLEGPTKGIFDFLIFWSFRAVFRSNFEQKSKER